MNTESLNKQMKNMMNIFHTYQKKQSRSLGDVLIENEIAELGEYSTTIATTSTTNTTLYPEQVITYLPIKKDYVVFVLRNGVKTYNCIIKYAVYAVNINGITYSSTLILRNNTQLPVIIYGESFTDPSDIVNSAYFYEYEKNRSLYLRKKAVSVNNPARLEELLVTYHSVNNNQIIDGTLITTNIDDELLDFSFIIKNKTYISDAYHNDLLYMANALIMF